MLTVPTCGFESLYALVILGLDWCAILHVEVTDHPTALWLAPKITETFPPDSAPAFLMRDNDGASGETFRQRAYAMGIRNRPTAPHSPRQNGYVERVIGSIRRECLDRTIILNGAHLGRVPHAYVACYNNDRTHLFERDGAVTSRSVLGGLHHWYGRKLPG